MVLVFGFPLGNRDVFNSIRAFLCSSHVREDESVTLFLYFLKSNNVKTTTNVSWRDIYWKVSIRLMILKVFTNYPPRIHVFCSPLLYTLIGPCKLRKRQCTKTTNDLYTLWTYFTKNTIYVSLQCNVRTKTVLFSLGF